jgi:hypothetical protein
MQTYTVYSFIYIIMCYIDSCGSDNSGPVSLVSVAGAEILVNSSERVSVLSVNEIIVTTRFLFLIK